MPVVSIVQPEVACNHVMRSRGAIRLGLRMACIRTPTRDQISSLLTLDPRFEGVRIQCADTVPALSLSPSLTALSLSLHLSLLSLSLHLSPLSLSLSPSSPALALSTCARSRQPLLPSLSNSFFSLFLHVSLSFSLSPSPHHSLPFNHSFLS